MSLAIDFDRVTPPAPQACVNQEELSVQRIQERLAQSHYPSLRKIGCEVVGGHFLLWGSVTSYYTKQMAQVLAGSVVGLEKIKNRIKVRVN